MQKKIYWYFHECKEPATVNELLEKVAKHRKCEPKDFKVLEIREV